MITRLESVSGWENQEVRCKNNDGFEKYFELGVTYLCTGDEYHQELMNAINGQEVIVEEITVMGMDGDEIKVERKRFELV